MFLKAVRKNETYIKDLTGGSVRYDLLFVEKDEDWAQRQIELGPYEAPFGEPLAPTVAVIAFWNIGRETGRLLLTDCSVYVENDEGKTIETLCSR